MSPARLHRERLAAAAATPGPSTPIVSGEEGGQPPSLPPMSPALEHRLGHAIAVAEHGGHAVQLAQGIDPAAAQVQLRLNHDLRRLKEIQSVARKIDAKREMIGEYAPWISSILEGAAGNEAGVAGDVLPTIMVWAIDIADWAYALRLAEHVLAHDLPLPSRYQRAAPSLIAEEIAEAALKLQAKGETFPLDVLEQVEALTADADMHDEIRAKLMKAIGYEMARAAEQLWPHLPGGAVNVSNEQFTAAAERALVPLLRAQDLNPRAGAKDRIKRLQRGIALAAKVQAEKEQAGTAPAA